MEKRQFIALVSAVMLMVTPLTASAMSAHVPGPNRAPVADAGEDRVVEPNQMVALDGSNSYDPDEDPLTYRWQLLYRPTGGHAELKDPLGMTTCRLSPDATGVWAIALTVSDGQLNSIRDVVRVDVRQPTPPTKPDLEALEVRVQAENEAGTKYIKAISIRMKDKGLDYAGPLEFRVIGLDKWIGGHFTLDEWVTIDSFCLRQDDEGWFTLIRRSIAWPANVPTITFSVGVDPRHRIGEGNTQNNMAEKIFERNTVPGFDGGGPSPASRPDFVITGIEASGLYQENKINTVSVELENKGRDYVGPLDFRIVATNRGTEVFRDNSATIDPVCIRQAEKKKLTLLRHTVEWPEDACSYRFTVEVDPHRHIAELNENNNRFSTSIPRGSLLTYCNNDVAKTIRIRDYRARMSTLKEGEQFTFDCSGGNKFDFFITLQHCCRGASTTELYIVYDWTPLVKDGENIILKKKYKVDFLAIGDRTVRIDDLKIPKKKKFQNAYTTFAILSRHDLGYDVIFSAPVRISGMR
jgi:hypothetical protein